MSIVANYVCDAKGCKATAPRNPNLATPAGWSSWRGWIAPEDRRARQGARPVLHFCPACTQQRHLARVTLGRKRLPVR